METVVRLAARGDGVTDAGRYIAGAVPGDRVDGDRLVAGPHRATPPCRHFGACGGCQLQHVDEETLAGFVRGRIVGALAGAGVTAERVEPVHLSPAGSRRRASVRALRTRDGVVIGFNVERGHDIVDLAECQVLAPALWRAVGALRQPMTAMLGPGAAANLTLSVTATGIDLVIGGAQLSSSAPAILAAWAEAHGIARISGDDGVIVQRVEPIVVMDGVRIAFPAGGFLQATPDGEAALQRAVVDACTGARRVADLFTGIGTFALPLSRDARVLAADAAGPAVSALAAAARAAGRNVETAHRDLFRQPYDRKALAAFDAVVLDPPRAGAGAQVAELARSTVKRVVYVSCNPNTFARDAKTLCDDGYQLETLTPVGQFRWSLHVELAAVFAR